MTVASAHADPAGYVRQTIALEAPPVALAFDAAGSLYALEEAGFGNNAATMRVFAADGSPVTSFPVVGEDPNNFFVGDMAYDPVGDRLLVTDNTTTGRIYAVGKSGGQETLATNFPTVAGIAVRSTGEIVISTAVGFGNGGVYQIDRTTGAKTQKMLGLGYGAGLVFDGGDLIVQDAASTAPYPARLQRVQVTAGASGLIFGPATEIISGTSAAYGVIVDSDGDLITTGRGGIFKVDGQPAVDALFYNNGNADQFATAIAYYGGTAAFEPFAGPASGVLAVTADGSDVNQDLFVTLFTPALPEDFNADGTVDGLDLGIWSANLSASAPLRAQGDADGDHDVDGGDMLRWQRARGASTILLGLPAIGAGSATSIAVPESTGCLAGMIELAALMARFRIERA